MTLKEATEAAKIKAPVIHEGIVYERIVEAGYWYNDKGEQFPFVTLLDKCHHSVSRVSPGRVEIYDENEKHNSEKP